MEQLLILVFTTGLSLLGFLFFLITGLMKKNRTRVFISIAALLLTIGLGSWATYLFISKSYNKVSQALQPRDGIEIYSALFGKPATDCVRVVNKVDQIVPRLDCCIWLEFKTCPKELNRILSLETYILKRYSSSDTAFFIPSYTPKPVWWTPDILGDSINVMQKYNPENPNRDRILIFSKDSSHAFYCDMAE